MSIPTSRFAIQESLWIRGETTIRHIRNAGSETQALLARGAKLFMLKSHQDRAGLEELRRLLSKSDIHVILCWLLPVELKALYPLLKERGNFSIVVDDWWIQPHWFMREARYVIFRKYHGIAVRTGQMPFVSRGRPPVFLNPAPHWGTYSEIAMALRLPALAASPLVDVYNSFRRRSEPVDRSRYLFFPFPIAAEDVPLRKEAIRFDFGNTGSTCGIWLMRDPFVPFGYTFGNLYYDRQLLIEGIGRYVDNPFKFYDCRFTEPRLPYEQYAQRNQQCRFLMASGGMMNVSVPKYLEYICAGVPVIGTGVPFEYPWLEECLFPLDMIQLQGQDVKPLLFQALERQAALRENCLKWREPLLRLYNINQLLDMLQAQADGQPIPAGYLKAEEAPAAG